MYSPHLPFNLETFGTTYGAKKDDSLHVFYYVNIINC